MKNFDKVLRRYIRLKGKPIGVVVAVSPSNIGYSLCNTDAGDHFSKDKAVRKAVGRAISQEVCDFNFWKRHILKKMSSGKMSAKKHGGYSGITADFLKADVGDEAFNRDNTKDNEVMVLHALKFIEQKAKEYKFN